MGKATEMASPPSLDYEEMCTQSPLSSEAAREAAQCGHRRKRGEQSGPVSPGWCPPSLRAAVQANSYVERQGLRTHR